MIRKLFTFLLLLSSIAFAQNYARMLSGVNAQTGTTYAFVAADSTRLTTFQNASSVAATLSSGSSTGFGAGMEFDAQNLGPGTVTITCSSCLIYSNGAGGSATYTLVAGQGVELFSNGANYVALATGTALPSAQTGDTIRFNVNNDNNWDAVNAAAPIAYLYPVLGGQPAGTGGMFLSCCGQPNNCQGINPTTTTPTGCQFSTTSSPQTTTNIGISSGENGNNSVYGILEFNRWTMKFSVQNTANARYWLGLASWCAGGCSGTGINGTGITGTSRYAQDSPNATTLGFRFSSGTDTHWQALSCIAGASSPSCTFVDTGITPDTNIHQFEMTVNYAKTQVNFYIDQALVASITTNVNFNQSNGNGWGSYFFTGDNKNTSTNVQFTFYSGEYSHRI